MNGENVEFKKVSKQRNYKKISRLRCKLRHSDTAFLHCTTATPTDASHRGLYSGLCRSTIQHTATTHERNNARA